jgi:hypothetical protein
VEFSVVVGVEVVASLGLPSRDVLVLASSMALYSVSRCRIEALDLLLLLFQGFYVEDSGPLGYRLISSAPL